MQKNYEIKGKEIKARDVDIIIPTYNQSFYVGDCVASINNKCQERDVQVIVVDDCSSNEENKKELEQLAEHLSFTLILKKENSGFAKTCNLGATLGKSPYTLFLNNDTYALSDFPDEMIKVMEESPNVGVVGAKLLYPNNTIQFAGHNRNPFAPHWFDHKYRGESRDSLVVNQETEIMSNTGACFLTSEEVLKKVEEKYGHYGFDPKYPMAFEDVDFCFKVRRLGMKIWYQPKAELYHIEGGTRGVGTEAANDPRQKESLKRFWEYWAEEEVDELSNLGY